MPWISVIRMPEKADEDIEIRMPEILKPETMTKEKSGFNAALFKKELYDDKAVNG